LDRAARALEEALETSRERGFRSTELDALVFRSMLEWRRGDRGATRSYAAEAVRLGVELGRELRIVMAIEAADLACDAEGEVELALKLLGAAGPLRDHFQVSATFDDPALRERCLAELTSRAGEEEATRLLADGADADLEELFGER
jgi:hypothetical protein